MAKIENLIIHCTATPEGREVTKKELMSWFKQRGWTKPGYRTMIHLDGQSEDLIEYDTDSNIEWSELTYGARGYNSKSIHIAYVGGVRKDNIKIPMDTRTEAQKKTLEGQVKYYLGYYPDIRIFGHYAVNKYKACPSFNVEKWLHEIGVDPKNIGIENNIIKTLSIKDKNMFDFVHE